MGSSSKRKGSHFERELVNSARDSGLKAERAYASNGRSLGHAEEVDLVVSGKRVQAKRRKKLLKGIRDLCNLLDENDAVVIREDFGDAFAIVSWAEYLDLIKSAGISLPVDQGNPLST